MPIPPPLPPSMPQAAPALAYALPPQYGSVTSVHREGALIVAPPTCHLPAGCVRCGEPEATTLTKKLSWHHPALFVMILFPGLLIYAIVALIVRKQGTVTFGLCERHATRRRKRMWIGGLGALLSIAVGIAGLVLADNRTIDRDAGPIVFLVGLLAMIACLIAWLTAVPVLKPKFIDVYQMKLGGAGPRYLDALAPDVPTAMIA